MIEHEEYEVVLDIANIGDSDAVLNIIDRIIETIKDIIFPNSQTTFA